eukprot:6488167-Amphidinium_carterae.3
MPQVGHIQFVVLVLEVKSCLRVLVGLCLATASATLEADVADVSLWTPPLAQSAVLGFCAVMCAWSSSTIAIVPLTQS